MSAVCRKNLFLPVSETEPDRRNNMNSRTKTITTLATIVALMFITNLIDKMYSQWLVAINGASLAVCVLITTALISMLFDKTYLSFAGGTAFGLVSFIFSFIIISPLFQNPLISVVPRLLIGFVGYGAYKLAQIIAKGLLSLTEKIKLPLFVPITLAALDIAGLVLYCIFGARRGFVFFIVISVFVIAACLFAGLIIATIANKYKVNRHHLAEHFSLTMGTIFMVISNTAFTLLAMFLFSDNYESLTAVYAVMSIVNFIPELLITAAAAPFVILAVRRGLGLGVDGKPKQKKAIASENTAEHKEIK